jgi:hypothetical protein
MTGGNAATVDGIPLILCTHVVANVRLIADILPSLVNSGQANGSASRIVHVDRFRPTVPRRRG